MCVLAFAARRDAGLKPLHQNNATAGDEREEGGENRGRFRESAAHWREMFDTFFLKGQSHLSLLFFCLTGIV